jgi:hypothetical protein
LEIRLPQPGKLIAHYDIVGAPDKARLFLQFDTWDNPGWSSVSSTRYDPIQQHVELVIDNLVPGEYIIDRSKNLGLKKNRFDEAWLDRRTIKIESGKTTVTDFVRPKGAPITGQVIGLDRPEFAQTKPRVVYVYVVPPEQKGPFPEVTFDKIGMESGDKPMDGKFTTERIPPGQYKVRAEVFMPEPQGQNGIMSTGIPGPAFAGDVLITVPEQGQPEAIKIQLAPVK